MSIGCHRSRRWLHVIMQSERYARALRGSANQEVPALACSSAAAAELIEAWVARIRVALRARLRLRHARRGPACGTLRRCGLRARRRLVRAFVGLCVDLRHVHATRLTRVHGDSGCRRALGMVRRGNPPPPPCDLGGTFLKKGAFFRMSGSTMSRTCEPRKKTLRHMRHCHQRVEGMSDHGCLLYTSDAADE